MDSELAAPYNAGALPGAEDTPLEFGHPGPAEHARTASSVRTMGDRG